MNYMMKSAVVFLLWWQITASQDILDPGGNGPDIVRQVYFEHNPLPRAGPQQRHAMRQNPLENMVGGLLLSGLSSFLLWWNEGRAVRDAQMLRRAEQSVVEIEGSDSHDDHEGKLVHTTGQLSTQRGLKDYDYGIHRPDALQLERTTQSYLWMEQRDEKRTRVNNRESRVEVNFRYHRGWTSQHQDSWKFEQPRGHENPDQTKLPVGKASQIVADTTVSGLMVPPTLVRQVGSTRDVRIGNGSDLTLPDDTMDQDTAYVISGHTLYMLDDPSSRPTWHLAEDDTASPSEKRPPKRAVTTRQQHGRISVVRTTPPRPSVGDIRVSWKETIAPQEGVSILALQQDGELVPWTDTKTKRTLYHIQEGSWSSKQMIQQLLKRSKLMTNVLRCVGFFGNYFGWSGFLSFLPAIVQRIPFLRFILAPLVGIATSLVAFGVSFGLSAAVFCLAWLRFRPLLAAGVAVLSGLGFYGPLYYAKFKRSPEVELMGESLMNGDVGGAFFDDGPEEKTI